MVTSFFRSNFGLSFGRVQGRRNSRVSFLENIGKPESVPDGESMDLRGVR